MRLFDKRPTWAVVREAVPSAVLSNAPFHVTSSDRLPAQQTWDILLDEDPWHQVTCPCAHRTAPVPLPSAALQVRRTRRTRVQPDAPGRTSTAASGVDQTPFGVVDIPPELGSAARRALKFQALKSCLAQEGLPTPSLASSFPPASIVSKHDGR